MTFELFGSSFLILHFSLHHAWPLIGNEKRLLELEQDLTRKTRAHAYLFSGPREVGKFTAAKFFANLILCPDGACGVCGICKQIRANVLPELTLVDQLWIEDVNEDLETLGKSSNFPQLHRSKNPKAKTDTIGIEDLREILSRLHVSRDGAQVFLIRRAERMTMETVNAFLKTLEEPPRDTIFLLTTDNLPLLPTTLVSRCRVVQFGNVPNSALEKKLTTTFPELPDELRTRIVNFATGKPGRAIRLARDPEVLTAYGEYFRQLKNLFEKPDLIARFSFAESVTKSATGTAQFLEALTYFLRSFLLTRARKPTENSRFTIEKLTMLLRATETTRELVSRNVNARLAVENLLLEI